nr:hypothetical protein [Streptococcus ruminantium]
MLECNVEDIIKHELDEY